MDVTKKRIGQLEEQKELLEQNRENNECIIMEKNALLGVEDGSIPKGGWIGEKNKTVRFENTGVSQERNTVDMDWDYGVKQWLKNGKKGIQCQHMRTDPKEQPLLQWMGQWHHLPLRRQRSGRGFSAKTASRVMNLLCAHVPFVKEGGTL